jgi:hypothetical protein
MWYGWAMRDLYTYEQLVYLDCCFFALNLELERVDRTPSRGNVTMERRSDATTEPVWRMDRDRERQKLETLKDRTIETKKEHRELPGG